MLSSISSGSAGFAASSSLRQEEGRARFGQRELSEEERRQVAELKKRDQEVRQHEQMHLSVGRDLVKGGIAYTYETGPDGRKYAVSGEVEIDTSKAATPEETVPKARHIRETALAPPEPSPQDRSVAALASRMEREALAEIARAAQGESADKPAAVGERAPAREGERESPGNLGVQAYQRMMSAGNSYAPGGMAGISAYA